jgi:cytoskeleton protein RodZ
MGEEEDTEGPKPVGPEAGPGAWLAAAREQAGLSLMQAADQLHLDVSAVKALEAGRFEVLGAAVYARGHLRRYAELLGLPAQEVEKSFLQLHPARSAPDLRHGAGLLQKSDAATRALRPRTAALGALVLVIIGVVLWARRVPHSHDVPARPVASAATVGADAPATAVAPAPAPAAPINGALERPMGPAPVVSSESADSAARFNGQPGTLWDPSASSTVTDGSPSHAASTHSASKAPSHTRGTHP